MCPNAGGDFKLSPYVSTFLHMLPRAAFPAVLHEEPSSVLQQYSIRYNAIIFGITMLSRSALQQCPIRHYMRRQG